MKLFHRAPGGQKLRDHTFLGFLIPFVSIVLIMLVNGITPFGANSFLYSDASSQYFPFFKALRRALLSGDSLLYSWDVGMGLDYLGLAAYYLMSPLNLLTVLMPESWLLGYFNLLIPIKLGLAGLSFSYFLKKYFGRQDLSIALFGSFYGLCAWALGYFWNIMWLDTFALLPLVVWGTVCLLRDRKFVLYTVTLFLSIAINYYIGLFTCIFVLLIFICRQICCWQGIRRFWSELWRIALFSALAIGMTAIISLPALSALGNTYSAENTFPTELALNIADEKLVEQINNGTASPLTALWLLFDAMRQCVGNFSGGIYPTIDEGLPNLYCGTVTLLLAVLYLGCKKLPRRERICGGSLLVFFLLSFVLKQLDYVWHGFHFTNMIPYRFSFLVSFTLLFMAYRAFEHRDCFSKKQLLVAWCVVFGIFLCSGTLWSLSGFSTLIYIGFNILVLGALALLLLRTGSLSNAAVLSLLGLELAVTVFCFAVRYDATDLQDYPQVTGKLTGAVEAMASLDGGELGYRTELTRVDVRNEGAMNGYRGITTFTSSANVNNTIFMGGLGHAAMRKYNYYTYEVSSPVSDLFLNLKYLIDQDGLISNDLFYQQVYSADGVQLLENTYYLPLGFMAQPALTELDFLVSEDLFGFQNTLLQTASGVTGEVWKVLGAESTSITADSTVTLTGADGTTGISSFTASQPGTLTYTYTADAAGLMCVDINLSLSSYVTISHNGTTLYDGIFKQAHTTRVGQVVPGDEIQVVYQCKKNTEGAMKLSAAILDLDVFQTAYAELGNETMQVQEFSNTRITGTVTCAQDGLLYTSIPQSGSNWTVEVDGKATQIQLVGNVMIGVPLSAGTHTVTFRYENRAFSTGAVVSGVCLALFAAAWVLMYKPKFKLRKQS